MHTFNIKTKIECLGMQGRKCNIHNYILINHSPKEMIRPKSLNKQYKKNGWTLPYKTCGLKLGDICMKIEINKVISNNIARYF